MAIRQENMLFVMFIKQCLIRPATEYEGFKTPSGSWLREKFSKQFHKFLKRCGLFHWLEYCDK